MMGVASSGDKGGYTNWMPGEPSNTKFDGKAFSSVDGTEACVYLHGSGEQAQRGRWGDLPCPEKMAFVCQVPLDGVTQAAIQASFFGLVDNPA